MQLTVRPRPPSSTLVKANKGKTASQENITQFVTHVSAFPCVKAYGHRGPEHVETCGISKDSPGLQQMKLSLPHVESRSRVTREAMSGISFAQGYHLPLAKICTQALQQQTQRSQQPQMAEDMDIRPEVSKIRRRALAPDGTRSLQ